MITEAIQNRPYNLKIYLENKQKTLGAIAKKLEEANNILKRNNGFGFLRTFLTSGGVDHEVATEAIYSIPQAISHPHEIVPAKEMAENIESWLKFGSNHKFQEYLMQWLKDAKPIRPSLRVAIASLKHAEDGMRTYGFADDDPDNAQDEDFVEANECLAALRKGSKALLDGELVVADMQKKIMAYEEYVIGNMYSSKWRPTHDNVEKLYHASIFVPELLREGFHKSRPDDRIGVGNFGTQHTISFTHDIEIARNIMRSFKELWMIAHGQLKASDIISWIRNEKINPASLRKLSSMNAIELYKNWQSFTKLRDNPVIVNMDNLVERLKERSLSDIGVISADVILDGSEEYMAAEREFRVLPEKITNIIKVL